MWHRDEPQAEFEFPPPRPHDMLVLRWSRKEETIWYNLSAATEKAYNELDVDSSYETY